MSSTPPPDDGKGLSAGAIIGIVIITLLILGGGFCVALVTGG